MTQFHGTLPDEPVSEKVKEARRRDFAAFPVQKYEGSWQEGMALRDYFAAHAPECPSWFAYSHYKTESKTFIGEGGASGIPYGFVETKEFQVPIEPNISRETRWRYEYADAMMKAREL